MSALSWILFLTVFLFANIMEERTLKGDDLMNKTIRRLLKGEHDNHMLPFFWQHGEDEATLRHYMDVIHRANCGAVCVESRPHPDFCGEKWWKDMDIILDEARKRDMKVWILDDSHFPTGFANNALADGHGELRKQSIFMRSMILEEGSGTVHMNLKEAGLLEMHHERFSLPLSNFGEDALVFAVAGNDRGHTVDLTDKVRNHQLSWEKKAGRWTLWIGVRCPNTASRTNYINVTQEESVRVLIDAVYEPHWKHYQDDFGKTIAGFFSDEPELGNFYTYARDNPLGTEQDLPWGSSLEEAVQEALGADWRCLLPLLWREGKDASRVRFVYMDCLTRLVRRNFSNQLGQWCREHGVSYIGHIIEDDGQHCKTSCSLGHYFRGLQGQDMSGIDNIGGQVLPQGEDDTASYFLGDGVRKGEFYHYGLAKLAQSAAAIEPRKQGNSMCEIFGNYGWVEGVRMEKYMADHFLVRGINQFVPHAFSPRPFPDYDCPPHFYAHGHHPQYRHFGEICGYMNRVATLTSSGKHVVPVAVLYHGELQWVDSGCMPFEVPLRALYDRQIDCHVIPADVFSEREYYRTEPGNPLLVNGQRYHALVIPEASAVTEAIAAGLEKLSRSGLPVYFINKRPVKIAETGESLPESLSDIPVIPLESLVDTVADLGISVPVVNPANDRIRILHIAGDTPVFFLVNESAEIYEGNVTLPAEDDCYLYDPWDNVCRPANSHRIPGGTQVKLRLEPLKSIAVVFGPLEAPMFPFPECRGECRELVQWERSLCPGIRYPYFGEKKLVKVPEDLSGEMPEFSGFIRYETTLSGAELRILEITDAGEGVEVFVNDRSLGIQIAPPFRYDLTAYLTEEENRIAIEVASTLERQAYPLLEEWGRATFRPPVSSTGLIGTVLLYRQ